MTPNDPWTAPGASEWRVIDAATLERNATLEADVVIVGTGAGGGMAAEILAAAGLAVIMIEEGPLRTARDFRMLETEAYPALYQESAARKTADAAINILQGRCVGGGTTVNWTSSFRTPRTTLAHWASHHGVQGYGAQDLDPWFARVEARLGIAPWEYQPNENNAALARGAARLGIRSGVIPRNVRACADLGYCGMGCPLNAKQSMLVTTVPAALERGATLVTRARATALEHDGTRVASLLCHALASDGVTARATTIGVRAKRFVCAAGAIGTPALMLRSRVPDPHALIGTRTFLHPTVVSAALMPAEVAAYRGAPQSIYSDHYLDIVPVDGPVGFKLEAPPVHPILAGITLPGHGSTHAEWMQALPNMQVLIALLRDGFHPQSAGGTVRLREHGWPVLEYPITPYLWDGVRRAFHAMAEVQFAAGARRVMPVHGAGNGFGDVAAARGAIASFHLGARTTPLVSAHVMGGAALGSDPRRAVVDLAGRHHHLENLYVADGSLFPTSIGANPQLSIYAIAARIATALAREVAGARA